MKNNLVELIYNGGSEFTNRNEQSAAAAGMGNALEQAQTKLERTVREQNQEIQYLHEMQQQINQVATASMSELSALRADISQKQQNHEQALADQARQYEQALAAQKQEHEQALAVILSNQEKPTILDNLKDEKPDGNLKPETEQVVETPQGETKRVTNLESEAKKFLIEQFNAKENERIDQLHQFGMPREGIYTEMSGEKIIEKNYLNNFLTNDLIIVDNFGENNITKETLVEDYVIEDFRSKIFRLLEEQIHPTNDGELSQDLKEIADGRYGKKVYDIICWFCETYKVKYT